MQNTIEIRLKCVELALMERDVIDKEAKRTYRGVRVPAIGGVPEPGDELLARAREILAWVTQESPQSEQESEVVLNDEIGEGYGILYQIFYNTAHAFPELFALREIGIDVVAADVNPAGSVNVLYKPKRGDKIPSFWNVLEGKAFKTTFSWLKHKIPKKVNK